MEENLEHLLEDDTLGSRYLIFQLDDEAYGIEIGMVTSIISIQPTSAIPGQPQYVRGIINLRGTITPIIDVRLRFGKPFQEYDERTCIIVVDVDGTSIGLAVDRVTEVLSIPSSEIVTPPDLGKDRISFVKGIGKVGNEVKLLLDCAKLFDFDDLSIMLK